MTHASCPSAVVGAPIEIVWLLLTDPARWGEPNGFVRQIHTRMPVILPEEITILCYPVNLLKGNLKYSSWDSA